jgi:rubrerythrin
MEEGFVLERNQRGNGVEKWVSGEPDWSWWTGVRLKGRAQHDIATWRCRKCGYLESYAPSA